MIDKMENLARSFGVADNSMGKAWDMWLLGQGRLSWTQEQIDNMTLKQLEQNKAAREEIMKLVEDLSKEMRRNQQQFRKMIEENVMNTYQHINYSNQNIINDLSKKVDKMAKQA